MEDNAQKSKEAVNTHSYFGQNSDFGHSTYSNSEYASVIRQRSLKDYFIMFRERIWYLIVPLFIFVFGALLYTVTKTKVYTAYTTVRLLRDDPTPIQRMDEIEPNRINNTEDFNTQISILKSNTMLVRVKKRLNSDELEQFLEPYSNVKIAGVEASPIDILQRNSKVLPQRMSFIIGISYQHPDPVIAARIANLFADEFSEYNLTLNIEGSIKAVQALKERVDQQRKRVEELELQLAEYREQNNAISLNEDENTMRADLLQIREIKLREKNNYDKFVIRWNQIETYREEGKALWELPFIANESRVVSLMEQISQIKIKVASLSKRYREKHPVMVAQLQALKKSESELEAAVEEAVKNIYAAYMAAKDNFELASQRLAEKETELFELSKTRIEYNSLLRVQMVEQGFLQVLTARMTEESAQINFKKTNVRQIDEAFPPMRHSSPNTTLNIAAGLFMGSAAGIGLIFLVAFLDDRIKNAFDIEEAMGLHVLGILTKIKGLSRAEKSQLVASNANRPITENFRSIYSTLKLNKESRDAKVILTTSTLPGEGKSFIGSNLALTFANHGEKTLFMDCDLRLPSVASSMQVDQNPGLLDYLKENLDIEKVMAKEVYPHLDIMPSGGKSKNPTRVFNSLRFKNMISELRKRYDRIIIDSPPLAAVSDALNLLSSADGVIYVIRFNTISRNTATANIRQIKQANIPIFGVVLNEVSNRFAYNYSGYSNNVYQDYYSDPY